MALLAECVGLRRRLTKLAGEELYGKAGSLSHTRVKKFLYETLGLPVQKKKNTKGEWTPSSAEVAVRRLQLQYGEDDKRVQRGCQLILDHRRADKLRSFYAEKCVDPDGRVRWSYSFTPETGRLSCGKNPMDTGLNGQNVDREARDHYIPDDGHIFLELDLSQAESRIVYMLARDKALRELARTPPWEYDVHTTNAAMVFGIPESEVTKALRYCGKRAIHAGHYGMQGKKLAEVLLLDGYVYTPEECDELIERYMEAHPNIQDRFQRDVRQAIMSEKKLVNNWGRELDFTYARLGDETYREGYAFVPQSSVADINKQWGLYPIWRYMKRERMDARLVHEIHDANLISTAPEHAWDIYCAYRQSIERPRVYAGKELTIPVEAKVGMYWGGGHEFKRPPTKREFEEVVFALVERKREAA